MAHSYPPGEQVRWNELERRILLSDVDIKRLWKAMPDPGKITSPQFDGAIPEPVPPSTPYKILLFRSGVSDGAAAGSYTYLKGVYDTAFTGSGNEVKVIGGSTTPSTADQDLTQYDLIYIQHILSSSFPTWIGTAAMTAWLAGTKQRRLVFMSNLAGSPANAYTVEGNAYMSGIGSAMSLTASSSGGASDNSVAMSHYLVSGLTTLRFSAASLVGGGTGLWNWTGSSPGNIMHVESTASGSEIILSGDDSCFITSSIATLGDNLTFTKRLYPSASYGGTLIP